MNECHDFWFWFSRPFAELLGTIAVFAAAALIAMGAWYAVALLGRLGSWLDRKKG